MALGAGVGIGLKFRRESGDAPAAGAPVQPPAETFFLLDNMGNILTEDMTTRLTWK